MRISEIAFEKLEIPMNCTLKVAFAEISASTSVIVKITTDEGLVGYGEAAPFGPVTGETCDTVLTALQYFRPALLGMDIMNIEGIHGVMDRLMQHQTSAKCAVDIAVYDIYGKMAGQPLYKILGGLSPEVRNDITVGIQAPDKMAEEAVDWVKRGYGIIKVKAGIDVRQDVETMALIRKKVGPAVRLRVDANQGYTVGDACYAAAKMADSGVEAIEQCLPAWDVEGHAQIRQKSAMIKIMLDESLHSPMDAMRIVRYNAADMFNIKLMKCGGLYPAMKINAIGEAAGVTCMVGCMMESKIAITAGLSLVAAKQNVTDADCDSFMFTKDPEMGMPGGYTREGDKFTMSDKPGLGLAISF